MINSRPYLSDVSVRNNPLKYLAAMLLVALSFAACSPNRIYEKNIKIPDNVWNLDFKTYYEVDIADTNLIYHISVNVRHTKFFMFNNLWIMVYTTFPDGTTISKRVELPLADKDGKWYGSCIGDICDVNVTIQERAYFNQIGIHKFSFEQIMRDKSYSVEALPGIMAMGLKLEKTRER